jgi:2-C-methyl-D-erythritol 4-phosphate cytidylyltransferase
MAERRRIWGILLAAGRGRRFGREKHDLALDGLPIWQHSHQTMERAGVAPIIVVGDLDGAVPGGARRRDSVAAGLAEIPDREGWVIVHDAARPLVTVDLIERVIERLIHGDVSGVIPVVPVRDTLKRVRDSLVVETIDRSDLAAVQTPQGFDLATLRAAHAASDLDATDDASMVESLGAAVAVVDGDATNLKVTYPEDLAGIAALRAGDYE